ncbi:MAG: efflux RND transporter periplasmic adaptor subunit [Deltaproteobacteria bacterium]|nr:efflux RND transporter periplasmic adaptor subunit [Deltaproteobacteria bacterium]
MKKVLVILVVVAALGAAGVVAFRSKENGPKYRTEKVVKGDITAVVSATGIVNPVRTVLVGTQVSGVIKALNADFNSAVKAGQLVAQIDPATFEAQREQARANVQSARANLEKAEASFADMNRVAARVRDLHSKKFAAQGDLDTAETNLTAAKAAVSAARAAVAQAEAAERVAETNLRYTRIVSPVDGTVIARNVDVGQTVAASFQTPTLFSIAEDLAKMQIDTNVAEADIGRVREGQDVEFRVDAYPDATFSGVVFQVRNAPITVQNVVTYDVVVKVDNSDLRLKPGMTANVSIVVDRRPGVLKVPNAALRFAPPNAEKAKGPGVYVLEGGKPVRVAVTRGISDGSFTEVAAAELSEGAEVVVELVDKSKKPTRPPSGMMMPRGP